MSAPAVRLILLEDSDDDAALLQRELAAQNFSVDLRRVRTRAEFLKALAEFEPDAILSDFRVPGIDAPQALALVRAARPELPFLCVSGTIGEEQAVELLKAGATDYVLKEKPQRLASCLRRALAEARERSDRRRAEEDLRVSREQLVQAQRMEAVGRLAGGVAHDFNNILTTISGYSELLLQLLPPDSPYREEIGEILSASTRATRLTRQLLAFSRRQVLEIRVLDLNEIVHGVQRMLARVIGEDVKIKASLAADLRRVRADASQIEASLMNLAINSRDAMPKGGTLSIATRPAGEFVELEVADTGEGMTADVRAHVFEPFFTTKEKGKGTGLGLSTIYGFVKQSGGSIDIESAPGRGCVVRIRLPATDDAADSVRGEAAAPAAGGQETILVVEDEAPLRQLLRRILDARGYRVLLADGAGPALKFLPSEPRIDLAIVDVVMPDLSGPALVEVLRTQRPALKVLFISGYAGEAPLPAAQSGRSFPFLAKPFAASVLAAKVRELLDSPA